GPDSLGRVMLYAKSVSLLLGVVVCATLIAADANAQGRARGGGGYAMGRVVPRGVAPRVIVPRVYTTRIAPRIVGVVPYRPYYYPYRPGLTIGFYSGYGYGYPYRYGYYGYPYGYPYASYGYPLPPSAYVSAVPGYAYGGVRIHGAPSNAQVFADGYYVGIVDDFDGPFQHLNLTAGAHR